MIEISETLQQLAEHTHQSGGLYLADGTPVRRQYPAEEHNPPAPYQDFCPCCGDQFDGVTAGVITPPDDLNPLQRVRWNEGGTSDWPPHLLRRI